MSENYECVNRINTLKANIEATTGGTYPDLTSAVQELKNGYSGSGANVQAYLDGSISGEIDLSNLTSLREGILSRCKITSVILPLRLITIPQYAFYECDELENVKLPDFLSAMFEYSFANCSKLSEITFKNTLVSINPVAFLGCDNLTTINVPWSEGEVANAPWGATNATINYNYTGG